MYKELPKCFLLYNVVYHGAQTDCGLSDLENTTGHGPEQLGPSSKPVFTDCTAWQFSFFCLFLFSLA